MVSLEPIGDLQVDFQNAKREWEEHLTKINSQDTSIMSPEEKRKLDKDKESI